MERAPNHHDAELVLKLYDLRREPVMRQSRAHFAKEFWPRNAAEMIAVTKMDHPLNTAYRQVTTYWEMAFALCRHGTLHPELLLDCSVEGLVVYSRMEPYLAELRAATHPGTLRHSEWMATQTEMGPKVMAVHRERVKKALAARAG